MTSAERVSSALADRYRIERELGQGGMATVYLAEDLRHKRKVALKVLKPELAAVLGADRFVQEIRTTAAMSHPHILPLFDSGEADGFLYYVMPYLQGETIREKLNRETQFGVDEAVKIATDVADALDYAHQNGVIHRDIKPENILLHNGRPMVMDFGIALAVSAAAGGRMTETGLSLGTPHYMSPEQATADKDITARSDIYSLASVLYEMLAGVPPHEGGSAQQVIMRIITDTPRPVTDLRRSVPPNVASAVAKALEKLPADRFATARDFALAVTNPAFSTGVGPAAGSAQTSGSARWRRIAGALGLTSVVLGALAAWALVRGRDETRDVGLPPTVPIQIAGSFRTIAASPDASFFVYISGTAAEARLWYRNLRSGESRPIPGTEGAAGTPRVSPDGQRVIFAANGELKQASITGGSVVSLGPTEDPLGVEWTDDGRVFFGDRDGRFLMWRDPTTGASRELEITYCLMPQLIDSLRVLCGGGADKYASILHLDRPHERIALKPASGASAPGAPQFLMGADFRLVDGRYLLYVSIDGALMATRIEDPDSLTFGRSVTMVPGVRRATYTGAGQFDVSSDGTLIWVPGINAAIGRLVKRSSEGRADSLPVPPAAFLRFTPSPDGRRLALVTEGNQVQELFVHDLEGGAPERVDSGFYVGAPGWSPDGRALAYVKKDDPQHERLLLKQVDVPGAPRVLASASPPLAMQVSAFLAPDLLLVGSGIPQGSLMRVDPTRDPPRIDTLAIASFFASISPDHRWLAWQPSGQSTVYLQPWPGLDRRYQVSAGGYEPRWASPSELWYLSGYNVAGQSASLYRARIDPSTMPPVIRNEQMFADPRFNDTPGWSFALTPAGEVLYVQSPSENLGYYVRVEPGWIARMKRAVDAANP